MLKLIDELAGFSEPGPGVTRLAWTPTLHAACRWVCAKAAESGLRARIDPAGNVLAAWGPAEAPAVLVGSHLDTVPHGGRFDGALGVLAALEVARHLRADGVRPRRRLVVAAFMDEEGARFGTHMFGSRAFVGEPLDAALQRHDARGVAVATAMWKLGFDPDELPTAAAIESVDCYLELHVEQGPVLEQAGAPVGVVAGVVGQETWSVRLVGRSGHAGSTPMDTRVDAVAGASRLIAGLDEYARADGDLRATVGTIRVPDGASNVVPGVCELSVDLRAPTESSLKRGRRLLKRLIGAARASGLAAELELVHASQPVNFAEGLQQRLADRAGREGCEAPALTSGAGHDAQVLADHVPSAMLFVRSIGGLSHHPDERSCRDDCERAVAILTGVVRDLLDNHAVS